MPHQVRFHQPFRRRDRRRPGNRPRRGRASARRAAPRSPSGTATSRSPSGPQRNSPSRGKVIAVGVDVADYAAVERARDETLTAFGKIDILVNNAGIAGPIAKLWDHTPEEWDQVHPRQPHRPVQLLQGDRPRHDRAELRPHRQRRLDRRQGGQPQRRRLFGLQGRRHRPDQVARQGARRPTTSRSTPSRRRSPRPRSSTRSPRQHIDYMLSKIPRGRLVLVEEIAATIAFMVSEECSFTTGFTFDISGGRATY